MSALDLEAAIREAIVDRYFEPTMTLHTTYVPGPTGHPQAQVVVGQAEAPAMQLARTVWEANREHITEAVMARLDVDALVEQIVPLVTKATVDRLLAQPDRSWSGPPNRSEREKMLAKVYDAVAEEFGRQCVARLRETGGLMAVLDAAPESTS